MDTIEMYLDWVNNYYTIELDRFAAYYDISEEFALAVIKEAKRKCEEVKEAEKGKFYPVGSVFKLDGRLFGVCTGGCEVCSFIRDKLCEISPPCASFKRKDGLSIGFKEIV